MNIKSNSNWTKNIKRVYLTTHFFLNKNNKLKIGTLFIIHYVKYDLIVSMYRILVTATTKVAEKNLCLINCASEKNRNNLTHFAD